MNTRITHGAGTIERALRQSLSQPGSAVAEAAGWDTSNVSRVLSGQQGVPINKLDAVVSAAGYVMVSREYLDAIGVLSRVGAYCHFQFSGVAAPHAQACACPAALGANHRFSTPRVAERHPCALHQVCAAAACGRGHGFAGLCALGAGTAQLERTGVGRAARAGRLRRPLR